MRLLPTLTLGLLVVAATLTLGCTAPFEEVESDGSDSALRQLQAGIDVDIPVIDGVALGSPAPKVFERVRSWSVRYVELRDPKDPENPDPEAPFNGFFLIARDAEERPLFFDTMALTDQGVAHFYFSVDTDARGNYLEIPLLAAPDDAEGRQRVEETVAWLGSERLHLASVIGQAFADDDATAVSPRSIQVQSWRKIFTGAKCVADLAVLGLAVTNPITFFFAQAAVDGTFALVDAATGTGDAADGAASAAAHATIGGVAKGVGRVVRSSVERGTIQQTTVNGARRAGGATLAVGMVGAIGYQAYENGARGALSTAIEMVVPQSCQETYRNITRVPNNDVAPSGGGGGR